MNISHLLAHRAAYLQKARLANLAYAHETLRAFADRLAQAVKVAIALPDVRSRLESMGNDAVSSTPAAFRARIEADYAKWKPLARFVSQ